MTREIQNNILSFEDYKSAINKYDDLAQNDPAKIRIDFPKSEHNKTAKDFFDRFFDIADGNPEWID